MGLLILSIDKKHQGDSCIDLDEVWIQTELVNGDAGHRTSVRLFGRSGIWQHSLVVMRGLPLKFKF